MRPPDSWARARVTLALTLLTGAVWILLELAQLQQWAIGWGGFVPARVGEAVGLDAAPFWLAPLTATLVHGHYLHLISNLLILAVCGRPTEAVIGPFGLAVLYFVGAYVAAAAHYLVDHADATPMIGASGAVDRKSVV